MEITEVNYGTDSKDGKTTLSATAKVHQGDSAETVLAVTQDWVHHQLGLPETASALRAEVETLLKKRAQLHETMAAQQRVLDARHKALSRITAEYADMRAMIAAIHAQWQKAIRLGEALNTVQANQMPTPAHIETLLNYTIDQAEKDRNDGTWPFSGKKEKARGPGGPVGWSWEG